MRRAISTEPPLTEVPAEAELYSNSREAAAVSGFRQFCTLSAVPMVLLRTPSSPRARECSMAQHRSEVASAAELSSRCQGNSSRSLSVCPALATSGAGHFKFGLPTCLSRVYLFRTLTRVPRFHLF